MTCLTKEALLERFSVTRTRSVCRTACMSPRARLSLMYSLRPSSLDDNLLLRCLHTSAVHVQVVCSQDPIHNVEVARDLPSSIEASLSSSRSFTCCHDGETADRLGHADDLAQRLRL